MPYEGHDELILDELWSFVGAKAHQAWVWIVLSRRNCQIVAFYVGARSLESAKALWKQVPSPWRNSLRFTNGYRVYVTLFEEEPIRHCRCLKQDRQAWGETSPVEGANNALRQGVSYLGRKSAAFARSAFWLTMRLRWFIHCWNLRQAHKFL